MLFKKKKNEETIKYVNLQAEILQRVSSDYNVSINTIIGKCRNSELVDIRCIIASVLFKIGYYESAIGRVLGGRHHTTVINLLQRTKKRKDLEKAVKVYLKIFK